MTMPCAWDVTVPTDFCSDWNDYPQATQDSALWLASTYLWAATGRQYGVCDVTVQPVQTRGGAEPAYQVFPHWPGGDGYVSGPFLFGGRWFNAGTGVACCAPLGCAVVLRGPVASIEEVVIDGEIIDPAEYRVDVSRGEYLLVRTGGSCWPTCNADGSFTVTYGYGKALPEALAITTALLACEYAKALTGGPCKLPARMTRMSRQGIDIEVEAVDGATGRTGIREIDDVIYALNPGGRQSPPVILSPDLQGTHDRMTVWQV
jgi:hypothetical protein